MKTCEWIPLNEEAQIGLARRIARRYGGELSFTEHQLAEIDILISELGTNALKFGRGTGQIFLGLLDERTDTEGLEVIYTDKGAGIDDTSLAVEDGFTTSGSMGSGLGAISRMADEFYIYSLVESQTRRLSLYGRTTHGTVIVARKHATPKGGLPSQEPTAWGALSRPPAKETHNGDAYLIRQDGGRLLVAVIDGLGHGEGASEASLAAVETINRNAEKSVEAIMRHTHEALRSTRGAVIGLASIDCSTRMIEYVGIGNTDFRVIGGGSTLKFISLNGTVGSRLDRLKVFRGELPKVSLLTMSTDGISERWDLDQYPGLQGLHPQLACAAILRDYNRPNDDATILCGRLSF
ncbi:MAG TPA: SpoIIE family protein phosphatase [Blastocatellia bacterium]|nr:SpoIIE family protein phosphatase [Blastocatellia bacterium]